MKVAKLFIPGAFEDALIHKGMLLIFTSNRLLRVLNFDHLIDDVANDRPDYASLTKMIFTGNHLLSGSKAKGFLGNQVVLRELEDAYESLDEPRSADRIEGYAVLTEEPDIEATVVLDTYLYNDRLYVGTNSGCYQQDMHFRVRGIEAKGAFTKRFPARCFGISAGFGALNLSCGDDGLYSFPDEFDWDAKINPENEFTELSDKSSRTSWIRTDLMNYPTSSAVELLRGKSTGLRSPNRKIVELRKEQVPLDNVLDEVRREHGVSVNNIQYVFNSERSMFFHTFDGHFFSVELKWNRDQVPVAKLSHAFKGSQARILSTQLCDPGLVIETMDRLFLFSSGSWHELLEAEVISVRTFQSAAQYKNLILVVTESGLYVMSAFDESGFRRHA